MVGWDPWDAAAVLLAYAVKGRVPHPLAAWLIPNGTRGALHPGAGAEVGHGARADGAAWPLRDKVMVADAVGGCQRSK